MDRDPGYDERAVEADMEKMVQFVGRFIRSMKDTGKDGESEEVLRLVMDAGLGPRHVPVLFSLVHHGPQSVGELARHLALSPATTSQLTGELGRGGFVERSPDERDRRRSIVSLHPKHRELIERFAWRRLQPMRATLAALTPQERAGFLRGWELLSETLESGEAASESYGGTGGISPGA